jgi:hypothetical protein
MSGLGTAVLEMILSLLPAGCFICVLYKLAQDKGTAMPPWDSCSRRILSSGGG